MMSKIGSIGFKVLMSIGVASMAILPMTDRAIGQTNPSNKVGVINFLNDIDDKSINELMATVNSLIAKGHKDILINIKTNGGSTRSGIMAYNYLASLPNSVTVRTHNISSVLSAGIMLYCGGRVRTAAKNSFFLMHNGTWTYSGNTTLSPEQQSEDSRAWQTEITIMRNIFSACTGKNAADTMRIFQASSIVMAMEAKEMNIVQTIASTELADVDRQNTFTICAVCR
jgi:ATP-dependent protease ClpP protease subunit